MIIPTYHVERLSEAISVVRRIRELAADFPNHSEHVQAAYLLEFADLLVRAEAYLERVWQNTPADVRNELVKLSESYQWN